MLYEAKKDRKITKLVWEAESERAFETSELAQREALKRDYTGGTKEKHFQGKE